jgi:glutamine synthetase
MEKMLYVLEYVWLDAANNFRSKTKIINNNQINISDINTLPEWNYDGSSTGQAIGTDSEIFLKPRVVFPDPFRQNQQFSAYLVWCDMVDKTSTSLENSTRHIAVEVFNKHVDAEPWFGLEQEYFIIDSKTKFPLGFNFSREHVVIEPESQGKYYCGVGAGCALGREIPEKHMEYCLYAGIKICGLNGEVAPGQWEYQIGPCVGIDAGDHLWISRYILNRIAESYDFEISYHPKPLSKLLGPNADWNGSGCHTNFSTKLMREPNGIQHIYKALERLGKNHTLHMKYYGTENNLRMSGKHETSSFDNFTFGRANRGASVRIPNVVLNENSGYFEDRRPAANCDPYLVTSLILSTCENPAFDKDNIENTTTIFNMGYVI